MSVLAIDAGTTGVTALLVSPDTAIASRSYQEFPQHYPASGWVEHDLDQIWTALSAAVDQCLTKTSQRPVSVGITNQRETVALWDKKTLRPVRRAIVWQDRRSTAICDDMRNGGHEPTIRSRTGLRLDPYFTATKLRWIRDNESHIWDGVVGGQTCVGTIDSYLVARATGGRHHVTDASNASRTLLFDIHKGTWDEELCELFGVPMSALPEVTPSIGCSLPTAPECFHGLSVPINGIAGDQQGALFGQMCFDVGSTKCTYGTGSFVLTNTGTRPVASEAGLLSTVAWGSPSGELTYALEGSVFVTGAAVQWLRDGLGVIESSADIEQLAGQVADSGGVVFVPALTGMGAPDWDPTARGAMFGLTRGTSKAHLARATLDSIAFQVRDVVDVVRREANVHLRELAVDGGASANNLLCQLQADQLGVPVVRPKSLETTALGAAFMAGLGAGVWSTSDELSQAWQLDRTFHPGQTDDAGHRRWRAAVEQVKGWDVDV